jgi:hypothetical protein
LPRVLRARWMPKINTWMDMGSMVVAGAQCVKR